MMDSTLAQLVSHLVEKELECQMLEKKIEELQEAKTTLEAIVTDYENKNK